MTSLTTNEMLRGYSRAFDGPANSEEARRYHIVQGERICGWSCDPSGPYYEQDKHLCPAECKSGTYVPKPGKARAPRIADVCTTPPPPLPQPVSPGRRATCGDGSSAIADAGVWLLIGVQTGPAHRGRRDGIRRSWKRWEREDGGVLVCFLIGRLGISPHLAISPHTFPHIPIPPHISPHLATSPHTFPHLATSPHTSPHLPIHSHTSPHLPNLSAALRTSLLNGLR